MILLNKTARDELKAGHSKAKCEIFSTLFSLQFLHLSVSESPVTKRCALRNDRPTRKWAKKLFPNFVPYLKWRCFTGLYTNFSFSLNTEISFICFTHLSSDDHNFEKKGKNKCEKFTDFWGNLL